MLDNEFVDIWGYWKEESLRVYELDKTEKWK